MNEDDNCSKTSVYNEESAENLHMKSRITYIYTYIPSLCLSIKKVCTKNDYVKYTV